MKSFTVVAALAGFALAAPQAVTSAIAPQEETPAGCKPDFDGKFQVVVEALASTAKRSLQERQESVPLEITLAGGVLTDAQGRTGYIASNNQFQFDGPAQAGAIYTSGWSVCSNGSLALGNSAVFYQCLSGTFYNLYDENDSAQCSPVYIHALGASASTGVAQLADGQPTAASAQPDGQITAGPAQTVVCQIGDGQIQQNTCLTTATPVAEMSDGQPFAPKATITQIGDGQIQAPTGAVVSQIPDGQIQAATSTAAVVSQIPDGQIQAASSAPVVSQIPDGQIQAATSAPVVSQIPDGQIQAATNATTPTSAAPTQPAQQTVNAAALPTVRAELFGLAAAVVALAAL